MTRIPGGLIDRSQTLSFRFNGKSCTGHRGDTLASALLANGLRLMGRSFKYHRPRGPLSASSEEPNALVTLRAGACAQPHARATVAELWDGLTARRQNHVGLLGFDARVSRKKDSIGAVMSRREGLAQDSRRLVGLQPGDPAALRGGLGPMDKPRRAAYLRGRRPPTPRREGRSPACRSS